MFANHQHYHRTRLLIAASVGLLIAIVATVRLAVPALGPLSQFLQFSALARAVIVTRLLSPVLSFLLVTGWMWVLLWVVEWISSLHHTKQNQAPSIAGPAPQTQATYRLERVNPSQETMRPDLSWGIRPQGTRPIAVPPLFQLDPQSPWLKKDLPVTPLPEINPAWTPSVTQESTIMQDEDSENEVEAVEAEATSMTQAEQIIQSQSIFPSQDEERAPKKSTSRASFSLRHTTGELETPPPVTLTLLKQMRVWVRADDGTLQEVKLRRGENAIRLIQLAYIAWRKGATVDRDKMLTYVLSRGKRREMDTDQLGEVFDAAKRYLRQDLDRAVKELTRNGHPLSKEVDFFSNEPGFYWLHPSCQVEDLERIEREHTIIQRARKEGLLDEKMNGLIPEWVVEACQKLAGDYAGDFLSSLLEKFPEEFGSWVKEPVTVYRDCYLDALLTLANYESALGKNFDKDRSLEQNEEQRRYHVGRAAQLFYDYAMYSLNSRWDQKLKFAYRAGKDGERVIRAARALRRCVVELGKLSNPDMIDQAYLAFKERMSTLSEGNWKPDKDTESDVLEARQSATSAYRFSSQIPMQNENKN